MRLRFTYIFPILHAGLWLVAILRSLTTRWGGSDALGRVLGVIDFPVSIFAMMLVWVLPEKVIVVGFGIFGTFWCYYLGRKTDEWTARRRSITR